LSENIVLKEASQINQLNEEIRAINSTYDEIVQICGLQLDEKLRIERCDATVTILTEKYQINVRSI